MPCFRTALASLLLLAVSFARAETPCFPTAASTDELVEASQTRSSPYVPVDSWIYPAMLRLKALGYLPDAFIALRPWTRLTIARMVEAGEQTVAEQEKELLLLTQEPNREPGGAGGAEARSILKALDHEFAPDLDRCGLHAEPGTVYSISRGITNTPLRDSYHLGQTIINDYGRPYQAGFNEYAGASGRAEFGRFSLYVRGEYQHAPSALGYSPALFTLLSQTVDQIPVATNPLQSTIPLGPIASTDSFRILEANASGRIGGHEISFGKSDHWLGPGVGGAFAYSNNAENIYAFQIDRTEPLHVPLLSDVIGPIRYVFFVGSLQGHTDPNHPYLHVEKLSFKPTRYVEVGFSRTTLWGGLDHEPVTIHTFLRSFFSFQNVTPAIKFSPLDPGYRLGNFDFSWQLPFLRDWVTLYTDSLSHDDVSPISAPRRAAYRPGVYVSHLPGAPKLDLRVEGSTSDPPVSNSNGGQFFAYEGVQRQGPTSKGFLFGDPNERESKGGDAWLTYHLSPQEQVQISWRRVKQAKDFVPGGTTQNEFRADVVKRFGTEKDVEGRVNVQYEQWRAPIYRPGLNTDVTVAGSLTWYPRKLPRF